MYETTGRSWLTWIPTEEAYWYLVLSSTDYAEKNVWHGKKSARFRHVKKKKHLKHHWISQPEGHEKKYQEIPNKVPAFSSFSKALAIPVPNGPSRQGYNMQYKFANNASDRGINVA